jgi:uncharacterized protein (TIGR03067 family)
MKKSPFQFSLAALLLTVASYASAETQEDAIEKDRKQMEGAWRVVAFQDDEHRSTEEQIKQLNGSITFDSKGNWTLRVLGDNEVTTGTSSIDPTRTPKTIDIKSDNFGSSFASIYEISEGTLTLCLPGHAMPRPAEFSTPPGSGHWLLTLERKKAK